MHGVVFLTATAGDVQAGEPTVLYSIHEATNATVGWNARTRRPDWAVAVTSRKNDDSPQTVVVYLPYEILTLHHTGQLWNVERVRNPIGRVPVTMLSRRPRVGRRFGMPAITRAVISLTDSAVRTLLRSEVSAEFFSVPQRYALGDVKTVLDSFEKAADPIVFRDALMLVLPEVLEPYCSAAGAVAAEWYQQLRDLADVSSAYDPMPSAVEICDKTARLIRYAVTPLFDHSDRTVFRLLCGGVQRLIANSGRQTIHSNMVADPVPTRWARVARPGCCAFCGMLASRGAAYGSRESASGVVTAGVPVGSSKAFTSTFHNHCTCVAVPLHETQQISLPGAMERFDDAYVEASRAVGRKTRQSERPHSDEVMKAILAHMRAILAVG